MRIAAQVGFDFDALDSDSGRDLCWVLYARAYPEPPNFQRWDALDAAGDAARVRERVPPATSPSCIHTFCMTSIAACLHAHAL